MVRFEEIHAALNAPGVVTSSPLSFNQLKIEIAKRLHIEADDAVFTENKQALKDAYVAVYTKVCKSSEKTGESAAAAKKPAVTASRPAASKPAASKPAASKPASRSAPAKKSGKKRQDSESEEEESDASESGSESEESERGGRPSSAFGSDPEARRLTALAKKCGVSVAKAALGASSARELSARIVAALNKAGLRNTDDPTPKEIKKVLARQEALADLDGIDPSNIVETSGRPRRAAAAKVDYRAVLKIEGLDSEDSDDGSDAGAGGSSSGSGSFSGSGDDDSDASEGGKKHSSKDKKSGHGSKEEKRSHHSREEKRRPKIKAGSSGSESASEEEAPAAAAPAEVQKRRRVIESDED